MRRGADCSHTLKALLSPDMRRSGGKGRSKGSRSISWMEYRTLWGGVSVALTLRLYPERVETKKAMGLKAWLGPLDSRGDAGVACFAGRVMSALRRFASRQPPRGL